MDDPPGGSHDGGHDSEAPDQTEVERERDRIRDFVKKLNADDVKSGNWFTKLIAHALGAYTKKVDWRYFQERYRGGAP